MPTSTTPATPVVDQPTAAATLPTTTAQAAAPAFVGTIILTDKNGARKPFPMKKVSAANWERFFQGGDGSFQINCDVVLGINDLSIVQPEDFIEIYTGGLLKYRGIVGKITRTRDKADSIVISGYSLWERLSKIVTEKNYTFPISQDLSVAMRKIADDSILPDYPFLQFYADTVGLGTNSVQGQGKSVSDIYTELLRLTGNRAAYGIDRNPATGASRLFLRNFDTSKADYKFSANDKHITNIVGDEDGTEVVTRIRIQGGTPSFPNLVSNSSFENLRLSSERDNILDNGGLDEPNPLKGNWFAENGASFKTGSNTEGPTYAGDRMVELDNAGEYIHQQKLSQSKIIPGHSYVFVAHLKRESGSDTASLEVKIAWKDNSGNTIRTDVGGTSIFYADSVVWRQASFIVTAPDNASGFRIDLVCVDPPILVDALSFYDASLVSQVGWRQEGTGKVEILDWAYPQGYHGAYCVRLKGQASDSDGPDISILSEKFAVQTRQSLRISCWVKSPPGVTTHPKIQLKVKIYDSNGSLSERATAALNPLQVVAAGSAWGVWTKLEATFQLPTYVATTTSSPTTCEAQIAMRGNGDILIDAFSVRDTAADPDEPYITDGPYTLTVGPRDVFDSTSPYYDAEDLYGKRWMVEQNDNVTSWDLLKHAAQRIFESYAKVSKRPTVTFVGMTGVNFEPGQTIALMGRADLLGEGNMPIYRVKEQLGADGLTTTIELEKEKPTLASIIAETRKKAAIGASSGAIGSSGGSGSGSSGGGVAGGSSGTDIPNISAAHTYLVDTTATTTVTLPNVRGNMGSFPNATLTEGALFLIKKNIGTNSLVNISLNGVGGGRDSEDDPGPTEPFLTPLYDGTSSGQGIQSPYGWVLLRFSTDNGTYPDGLWHVVSRNEINTQEIKGVPFVPSLLGSGTRDGTKFLRDDGAWQPVSASGGGTGTVTSVALSAPASLFSVSGSPVTTAGTLSLSLSVQTANTAFMGPVSGTDAAPGFRAFANADFPLSGVTAGTYNQVTVNDRGIVTSATNTAAGTFYWGSSARTSTDATLHDNYAPTNGPHIQSTERTNWQNTFLEVANARNRDSVGGFTANNYPNLKTHINILWQTLGQRTLDPQNQVAGRVAVTNGTGGLQWQTLQNGTSYTPLASRTVTFSSGTNLTSADDAIQCNGNTTVVLPDATTVTRKPYYIYSISGTITISSSSSSQSWTIETGESMVIMPGQNNIWNAYAKYPAGSTGSATGTAGGDLFGTYPTPSVVKLQGVPVSAFTPSVGQVLKFNGTSWAPGTDNASGGTSSLSFREVIGTSSGITQSDDVLRLNASVQPVILNLRGNITGNKCFDICRTDTNSLNTCKLQILSSDGAEFPNGTGTPTTYLIPPRGGVRLQAYKASGSGIVVYQIIATYPGTSSDGGSATATPTTATQQPTGVATAE